jgi:hypothetical protein
MTTENQIEMYRKAIQAEKEKIETYKKNVRQMQNKIIATKIRVILIPIAMIKKQVATATLSAILISASITESEAQSTSQKITYDTTVVYKIIRKSLTADQNRCVYTAIGTSKDGSAEVIEFDEKSTTYYQNDFVRINRKNKIVLENSKGIILK